MNNSGEIRTIGEISIEVYLIGMATPKRMLESDQLSKVVFFW